MKIKLSRKWWISIGVTAGLLALLWATGAAVAQKPGPSDSALNVSSPLAPGGGPSEPMAFSYQGRLMDGGVPANGNYDFIIDLYDNPTVGSPVAACINAGTGSLLNQPVQNGLFTFYLYCGSDNSSVFTGDERWIEAHVRRTGTMTYTTLLRQPISPVPYAFSLYPWAVISSTAIGGSFGDSILNVYNRNTVATWSAFHAKSASGYAVRGESPDGTALYGYSTDGYAVYGTTSYGTSGHFYSGHGYGLEAQSNGSDTWDHAGYFNAYMGYGVYAKSIGNMAIRGEAGDISGLWQPAGPVGVAGIGDRGVWGSGDLMGVYGVSNSSSGYGGYFNNSSSGIALYAYSNGATRNKATLRAGNYESSGGMAAYLTNNSNYHNAHFYNSGSGGVLYLQNGGTGDAGTGGGDFITALNGDENDAQFRVLTNGEVRSDVGYYTPAADFAEMLPAAQGLNPGDVLIVGQDGKLVCSTQPFQTSVMGVYSTKPGFVGGRPVEGDLPDRVPLAIVGVVPVKVSAENGPILPGDLIVTSSAPGHAMKAGPNPPIGTVIGKALGTLAEGKGVIQMLVTLQ